MPVAEGEAGDEPIHGETLVKDERIQAGAANEESKEEVQEQQLEEVEQQKYEEATQLASQDGQLLDKKQEVNEDKTQEGEGKKTQLEGGQGSEAVDEQEGKFEEVGELQLEDGISSEKKQNVMQDGLEHKKVNEKQLEGAQGASEAGDDQGEKFEEAGELQLEDAISSVKEQNVSEKQMQDRVNEKHLERAQGASEAAEEQQENFEEVTELQLNDCHPLENGQEISEKSTQDRMEDGEETENHQDGGQGASEAAKDTDERVVSMPSELDVGHPLEKMLKVSEHKVLDTMEDGEDKKQLGGKEPSEDTNDCKETLVSMLGRQDVFEVVQGSEGEAAPLRSEAADVFIPTDEFVDSEAVRLDSRSEEGLQGSHSLADGNREGEAESIATDMAGAGTISVEPGGTRETAVIKEPATEKGTNVVADARIGIYTQDSNESGKEDLEVQESTVTGNEEERKFHGKELEAGELWDSKAEVQNESQQKEPKMVGAHNVDEETRGAVPSTETLVSPVDHHLTSERNVPESREIAEDLQVSAYSENLNFNEQEDKVSGIGIVEFSDEGKVEDVSIASVEKAPSVKFSDAGKVEDAKVACVGEAQSKPGEEKPELHENVCKAQAMEIEETQELHKNIDEGQVVVEAIPVEIEEKLIPDQDGKLSDETREQDECVTEIREPFNVTSGREKKPMPDATFTVESDRETAKKPSESSATATASAAAASNNPSVSGAGLPLPARPAGLGSSVPLLEPAPRSAQHSRANGNAPSRSSQLLEDQTSGELDENNETREKLQMIRVKFLRLAHRLGQTPHNVVVAQVLYRLGLAEQLRGSRNSSRTGAFSFDRASAMAEQQEAAGQEGLDFTCTIMVLGKTGVGKSATINSIFDEVKCGTDAFQAGTQKVQEIVGTVQGIKLRVIDTPGLLSSFADQRHNERILVSVKRFIKKAAPDIVLYFDRLDMQSRDHGDLPLLRTITDTFGPSVWFNAIVVLTHAASAPPDGPYGTPLSYEMFVAQRSHVVQQAIRQAAGDMRLMNPVSLVENHSACRTNRAGQRVLPNGQIWKPQLLLLCFASKILAEANSLLKLQDSTPGKTFGTRPRVPPLPFLLSSLLQSRAQLKVPEEQFGDGDASDEDLDEVSDSEDEAEYDQLPPFKRLTQFQLSKLNKEQKKAYFDELEYREKLYMKKQLKEERRRRMLMKKMSAVPKEGTEEYDGSMEDENASAASVPVPMPDMVLPPSFDADNPSHRYRYLDTSSQWLVRPVLETHGWDHDIGYEGLNLEKIFVIGGKVPVSVSGQVTKDKKEANLQMECAATLKHGEGKATLAGFDIQTVGKELAYTLRSETRFSNFKHNKTTAGLAITLLGDALAAGMKLEDRLMIGKRFKLVLNGGAITGRGDVAYGGSLEATLRDKDYPVGRSLSTLGLSIMDWHGDLAIGCNLQSQFAVGRNTTMIARANLNNRGAGQVSIRMSSSEQLQIALIGIIPIFRTLIGNRLFGSSQPMP